MGFKLLRVVQLASSPQSKTVLLWSGLLVISLAPVLPLSNFAGHPHWNIIRWIPFQDFSLSPGILKDVMGNAVWFMMFGYLLYGRLPADFTTARTIAMVALIGGGISLSTELFQVFCHNRVPSTTDIICNIVGAGLGGLFAKQVRSSPEHRADLRSQCPSIRIKNPCTRSEKGPSRPRA